MHAAEWVTYWDRLAGLGLRCSNQGPPQDALSKASIAWDVGYGRPVQCRSLYMAYIRPGHSLTPRARWYNRMYRRCCAGKQPSTTTAVPEQAT